MTDEASVISEVRAAYQQYIDAFNRRDVAQFARCYDRPNAGVSAEHGLIIVDDEASQETWCQQVMASADEQGWARTDVDQLQVWPWSPTVAQLVADVTRYKTDGTVLQRIRASYLLRRGDGAWKVVTYGVVEPGYSGPGRSRPVASDP